MGWNENTHTMTAPLNIDDISDAVNADSGDLGTCIKNGDINKGAKYKPVRHYKQGQLTDSDLAYVNYGFRTDNAFEGGVQKYGIKTTDLTSLFTNAANNVDEHNKPGDWPYIRPRGAANSEWFRMMDFVGYHSDVPMPIEVFCTGKSYSTKGVVCQVYDKAFEDADLSLLDFTGFATTTDTGRTIDEWRLGVAWKTSSGPINANYLSKTLDDCFEDPDGEGGREMIPMGNKVGDEYVLPIGTYTWCAFITDYDPTDSPDSGNSYRYVYLPGGYGSIQVLDSSSGGGGVVPPAQEPLLIEMDNVYDLSGTSWGNTYLTDFAFSFIVSMRTGVSDDYELEVSVKLYDANNNLIAEDEDYRNSVVEDDEDPYVRFDDINLIDNYTTDDIYVSVRYRYRINTSPSWTQWTQRYFNPISGQEFDGQISTTQLQDIIDELDENNV